MQALASVPTIRISDLLRPGVAVLALATLAIYAVFIDQGAAGGVLTSAMSDSGGVLHELFHDARHLLGVACH